MIHYEALRADAARSRARISAFLSQARPVVAALGVYGTFRPAIRRATDVIFQARADRHARVAAVAASGERSTRGRDAGIRWCRGRVFVYLCKRITQSPL